MRLRTKLTALGLAVSALTLTTAVYAGDVVWWTPNWSQARAQKLADDFHKANPDINIKLQITTSNGLPQQVMTALQSGSGPDIIEVQHGWVQGYAQNDLVLPLDDTIQQKDDYNKAVIAEDITLTFAYVEAAVEPAAVNGTGQPAADPDAAANPPLRVAMNA